MRYSGWLPVTFLPQGRDLTSVLDPCWKTLFSRRFGVPCTEEVEAKMQRVKSTYTWRQVYEAKEAALQQKLEEGGRRLTELSKQAEAGKWEPYSLSALCVLQKGLDSYVARNAAWQPRCLCRHEAAGVSSYPCSVLLQTIRSDRSRSSLQMRQLSQSACCPSASVEPQVTPLVISHFLPHADHGPHSFCECPVLMLHMPAGQCASLTV